MPDIRVEVVYALPERQYLRQLVLEEGSTLEQAIRASGLLALRQDIDLGVNKVGIFSRPAKLDDTLSDGDRVEIYRPLLIDPKELRRQRAERTRNARGNNPAPLLACATAGDPRPYTGQPSRRHSMGNATY